MDVRSGDEQRGDHDDCQLDVCRCGLDVVHGCRDGCRQILSSKKPVISEDQTMDQRTVWDCLIELRNPSPEPFAVLRVDTKKRRDGGIEGTIVSLHMIREEAEKAVYEFNNGPLS